MLSTLFANKDTAAALIWAGASFAIALLLWAAARAHHRQLPQSGQSFGIRWYGRLMPLIPPVIAILLLAVGKTLFRKTGIDTTLSRITIDVALSWFMVSAIYVTTHSIGKTLFAALVIVPYAALSMFGMLEDVTTLLSDTAFSVGKVKVSALALVNFLIGVVILAWIAGAVIRGTEFSLQHIKHLRGNTRQLFLTLTRTCVYIAVFLAGLSLLGIDLTAFAIFGGALGVGLGFGLQKIASNFISGMILLVERSIDVNDLIEIPAAGISGLVKYTGARYTLIETYDSRDIMIPNEDFITQRVINWTFSSPRGQLRMVFNIPYDSDIERARQLILDTARAHPRCLADPKPHCLIQEFTDIAVVMVLYVWIGDIREKRLTTQSEILTAIWHAFRENGIGIAHQSRHADLGPKPPEAQAAEAAAAANKDGD